jgi:hypothetical protein
LIKRTFLDDYLCLFNNELFWQLIILSYFVSSLQTSSHAEGNSHLSAFFVCEHDKNSRLASTS